MGIQQQTPTPKKRKSHFKKKFKDKKSSGSNIISGPSDVRHNICLTPSRTEMSKTELSLANVPADGVKGKTWGPSTGSSHVKTRPTIITENPNKSWKTTSAPSLEKSPRQHCSNAGLCCCWIRHWSE